MPLKEKNRQASLEWRAMAVCEKEKYQLEAKNLKMPNLLELDEKQKAKLISAHTRNLLNEDIQ